MLIDGEKWACEACVRGHRVSTCQHSDRQLTHINKKGRPVSQCPHCRGLRKARASHVQCECGAKPHSKDECNDNEGLGEFQADTTSDPGSQDHKVCCCSHGARCTCAIKKEYMDLVPEIDMPVVPPMRSTSSRKPRLLKADSDNSLTVFTNGHHKPIHKHNVSAHKCGLPYKIPIPHSVPGNDAARRSTDSLPLTRKKEEPHSQLHDSISSAQQDVRRVRSEHGSPERSTARFADSNGDLPPLDLSYAEYESVQGQYPEDYSQSPRGFKNYYSTSHEELPSLSAGMNMPAAAWSAVDLPLDGAYSVAYSQPPSYASFEHSNVGQQGLKTSSSGELSEVGDYVSHNPHGQSLRPEPASTSAEELKDNSMDSSSAESLSYNPTSSPSYPTSSSSFTNPPHISLLSSNNLNERDITFIGTTASPTEFEEPTAGMPLRSEAFAKHGFTVHDAQRMAHPETPTEEMGGLKLPPQVEDRDHVWAKHFDSSEDSLVPGCKVVDDWEQ
ncbi:MAG: hypothetical protein Q9175_006113 [Cornicularia normoerica]